MKKGFTLITAIIFMVLIATIGAIAVSMSTFTAKQTSDTYLKTQAELLAMSATEYAILAIHGHDILVNGNCVNQINATYPNANSPLFDINVTIFYFGKNLPVYPKCNILGDNNIVDTDSGLTVMIDTFVQSHNGVATEPIRFHKRTLQRP